MSRKRKYCKPRITQREKVEVLAAVCDSSWTGPTKCMKVGESGCIKTRL